MSSCGVPDKAKCKDSCNNKPNSFVACLGQNGRPEDTCSRGKCTQYCFTCNNGKIAYEKINDAITQEKKEQQTSQQNTQTPQNKQDQNQNQSINNSNPFNDKNNSDNVVQTEQVIETKTTESITYSPTSSIASQPTNTDQNNNNNSNNNNNKPKGLGPMNLYVIGAGVIVFCIIVFIIIIKCIKKPKNKNNKGDRNHSEGYNQLNDDNYRTLTGASLHTDANVDNNPFAKIPSFEELPTIDSILIENKKNNTSFSQNNTNTNSNNTNNNNYISYNKKDNNSITKIGSSDKFYNSPRNASQSSIDVHPMTSMNTVMTTNNTMYSPKTMIPTYNGNNTQNMQFNSYDDTVSSLNTSMLKPSENKQSYSNMPYSPNKMSHSPLGQTNNNNNSSRSPLVQGNPGIIQGNGNNYYQNGVGNTAVSNSIPKGNLYIYTNQNENQNQNQNQNPIQVQDHSANPFSDSHATSTPTDGYTNDLNTNTKMVSQKQNSNDLMMNNNYNNQAYNKNHSIKNEDSYGNSPRLMSSLKSPINKHQSIGNSPVNNGSRKNRNTITSPHDIYMSPNSLRTPTTPKTPRAVTPNINGTPKMIASPSTIKPATPTNHYTPKLERAPSGKSTHSNTGTSISNMESYSQRSNSSTPVMENLPSGKQTLERHHSKSGKAQYSTANLERVPSSGQQSSLKKRTPLLDNKSSNMKLSTQDLNKDNNISSKSPQPKSILKNANATNNVIIAPTQEDLALVPGSSLSLKRKKSKGRKAANTNGSGSDATNIPPFPSMSRKASGVLKDNNSTTGSYSENLPTTPLRPPQLTVFGHAVATPPTPKSTRFPQDAKVLPPTERNTPMPPDILGGTDTVPLNTMTLQRKHFHKRNKSVNAAAVMTEDIANFKPKINPEHPLPVPPPHNATNNNTNDTSTNDDTYPSSSERHGRSQSQDQDSNHFRSKSLPRLNKYGGKYGSADDQLFSPDLANNAFLANIEPKLTSFELEFYKENESQKVNQNRSIDSVLSILYEEKRNMEYYITHCDD